MPPHRDALARRIQIGFGCYGILVIAQLVAGVGQHFNQGNLQVGHVPLGPTGQHQCQAVQNQLAKAGIVFGQIVNLGFDQHSRWARPRHRTIQIRWAIHFEREINMVIAHIQVGNAHQTQGVG